MSHASFPNIRFPTLGGQQLWQDVYFYAAWRIQKNFLTGHYRLLNPKDTRYAWESYEACLEALEGFKKSLNITNPDTHLVLMVHGMAGWKENFFLMKRALRNKGYFADAYNYTSLSGTLDKQSADLVGFLDSIEGVKEITFIGHSQGGIVIRDALLKDGRWKKKIKVKGMILLGSPNQGATLADFSKRLKGLEVVTPKIRDQLTKSFVQELPAPKVRTGLIAGTARPGKGINPLIPGDDDGVVGVEEVWIDGIEDRLIVRSDHFTLSNRRKTIAAVLRFLEGSPLAE